MRKKVNDFIVFRFLYYKRGRSGLVGPIHVCPSPLRAFILPITWQMPHSWPMLIETGINLLFSLPINEKLQMIRTEAVCRQWSSCSYIPFHSIPSTHTHTHTHKHEITAPLYFRRQNYFQNPAIIIILVFSTGFSRV